MTYFPKDKFSSGDVAGAVAEAAIHDLRTNLFTFPGFPQIRVSDPIDDVFVVTLSWGSSCSSFNLNRTEAKTVAKKFKLGKDFDRNIFDRVQDALAELEGKSR